MPGIVVSSLRKYPSGWLLAAQLVAVLASPFLQDSAGGRVAFLVFGNVMLALTLWVVMRSPVANWIGWTLAVPAVALSVIAHVADEPRLLAASHAIESALYMYAAIGLIHYMLSDRQVTSDELIAAGATFTLLAWSFAFAFSATQGLAPGSFTGGADATAPRSWFELLFLSFSALSSVGLSDIVPVRPFARSLLMLEMFFGVMYVAVVVSRLIALATLKVQEARDGRGVNPS